MRSFIPFPVLFILVGFVAGCSKNNAAEKKYKGRLEITGVCMNYTITILEGNIDTSVIVANWTDPVTNKSYTNVFRLGSICDFPATIKQGDEFYFTIGLSTETPCAVCLAYYPTPSKSLSVKVVEK